MCECFERVNKELEKKNTILNMMTMVNMENGKMRQAYQIATTRLHRGRTKIIRVAASFCPFCGKKQTTT